jgi:hypothetical protein
VDGNSAFAVVSGQLRLPESMKQYAVLMCLWAMSVPLVSQEPGKKAEPDFEIKTRTLGHAGDGSPDSRDTVGIGEWVELSTVPETISNVEWVIKGDSRVTNRFGNPTILIVGDGGEVTIAATVHDTPQSAKQPPPDVELQHKWQELEEKLDVLAKLADKPAAFEAKCEKLAFSPVMYSGLAGLQYENCDRIVLVLSNTNATAHAVPISYGWVRIQTKILEAAALRLGTILDSTADKNRLRDDFWQLLHACVISLECQNKQFEDAGGEANAEALGGNGKEFYGALEYARKVGANAFSVVLPDLRYLMYVQVLNALPKTTLEQKKTVLIKHGFSEKEAKFLLEDADCHDER